MTTDRYALIRPNEDGNPLRFLTFAELGSLLADPSQWGVAEFGDLDALGADPNYWPDKVAVLIRFEEVKPERARGYFLPAADPYAGYARAAGHGGWTKGPDTPITLGEVRD